MDIQYETLNSRQQTANKIYEWANNYSEDLRQFESWSLPRFYNYVHSISFAEDPPGFEIISRPEYLLDTNYFISIDCKKKATLFAGFFELKGWDYVLVGVSDSPEKDVHHILPMVWTGDDWLEVDATMPEDSLDMKIPRFNYEVF